MAGSIEVPISTDPRHSDDRLVLYFLCCLHTDGNPPTRHDSKVVPISIIGVQPSMGFTLGYCGIKDRDERRQCLEVPLDHLWGKSGGQFCHRLVC